MSTKVASWDDLFPSDDVKELRKRLGMTTPNSTTTTRWKCPIDACHFRKTPKEFKP